MTALTSNPSVQALAWTLVHFLWQGAAIGVLVFVWLRAGRPTAQVRYAGAIGALVALILMPAATFTLYAIRAAAGPTAATAGPLTSELPAATLPVAPAPAAPMIAKERLGDGPAAPAAVDMATLAIVGTWAAGVLLLSLRLAGGWMVARRLAACGVPPAADIRERAAALSRRLGLTRAVRIIESTTVTVPVLVGWMKPVILFPAAVLSGLSAGQVDALIAHELAHVRRHDYLVNILQSIVETLLFYHPAVWFVSREVRDAREQCCDDLAIGVCDRVVYVSALADLAATRQAPRFALAATAGSLLERVQRLLGHPHERCGPGVAWLGVLTLALVVGGVMPSALRSSAGAAAERSQGGLAAGPLEGVSGGPAADGDERAIGSVPRGMVDGGSRGVEVVPGAVSVQDGQQGESLWLRDGTEQMDRQRAQELTTWGDLRTLEARLADIERQVAAAQSAQQLLVGPGPDGAPSIAHFEARAARVRAAVDAARDQLARGRQLHDAGLRSSSALREEEERLASSLRELSVLTIELRAVLEETAMRDALDTRWARFEAESRLEQARAELGAARQSLEEVRRRYEIGTANRDALWDVEARLAAAEHRHASAITEHHLQQEEAALRQRRTDGLRRLVRQMEEANAGALAEPPVVDDPAARTRAGDILTVEIAGEPDLPRHFTVDANGTIRLPLVGPMTVVNLTAQQVRDAVTAAVTERKLAEGRAVTVTLRRTR
jgi:beta-lactamase regulating signal transducer with metallopeptidase domain